MGIAYKNHSSYPKNIFIRDFEGSVNLADIIRSWEFLLKSDRISTETKGIINDLTDCHLEMDMKSFHTLMDYLKEHKEFGQLKLAVICDDPRTIVFPTLGEVQEKSLRIKPFASEGAAVNWIMDEV